MSRFIRASNGQPFTPQEIRVLRESPEAFWFHHSLQQCYDLMALGESFGVESFDSTRTTLVDLEEEYDDGSEANYFAKRCIVERLFIYIFGEVQHLLDK